MRWRALPSFGGSRWAIRRVLGLQAQPFESHTGSAHALPSSPPETKKGSPRGAFCLFLAERVGFEPTVRSPVRLISSQVHSTTLPPLLVTGRCIRERPHYSSPRRKRKSYLRSRGQALEAAHVWTQHFRDHHAAVRLL